MSTRIAIWTIAGIIAAAGWGRHVQMPITVYQTIAINAATYALVGLMLELAWRACRFPRPKLGMR